MSQRLAFAFGTVAALLGYMSLSVPAHASDLVYPGGGTLAQVVDGGGTYTIITLVNLDMYPAPYTLTFYADSGAPLSLSTTAGPGPVLTGTIPIGGSVIIQTNGGGSTILQGYGVLNTATSSYTYDVAGSAVFGIPLTNSPVNEASCPLDTGLDYIFGIPFDHTTATTGLAMANSIGDGVYQTPSSANLAINFYDQTGFLFYSTVMQLTYGQHIAFNLPVQFPQTANMKGTMVITSRNGLGQPYAIKTLGLRANLAGTTFTSITPIVPCVSTYNPNSGTYFCAN